MQMQSGRAPACAKKRPKISETKLYGELAASRLREGATIQLVARLLIEEKIMEDARRMSRPKAEAIAIDECVQSIECGLTLLSTQESKPIENANEPSPIPMLPLTLTRTDEIVSAARLALDEYFEARLEEMPRRSGPRTPTCEWRSRSGSESMMVDKLARLLAIDQPVQCTPAWYEMRNNLMTASSAWKAIGTPGSVRALLREKVDAPQTVEAASGSPKASHSGFVQENTPLQWGKKFEPLSVLYYEARYNTAVQEYGCLIHPAYPFMGASPDGINFGDDASNPLLGRMLEIKNVVSRVITGVPKEDYWIQMQLQMEVCDLDECDFLETQFVEHADYAAYVGAREAYVSTMEADADEVSLRFGTMAVFAVLGSPDLRYEYGPMGMSTDEAEGWLEDVRARNEAKGFVWYKNLYWELVTASCVLVRRNRRWFASVIGEFDQFWKRVLYYRDHANEWLEWKQINAPASRGRISSVSGSEDMDSSSRCILFDLKQTEQPEQQPEQAM